VPSGGIGSLSTGRCAEVVAVNVTAAELEAGIADLSTSLPSEEVFEFDSTTGFAGPAGPGGTGCDREAGKFAGVVGAELEDVCNCPGTRSVIRRF
jgi:hypothetical protein